MCLKNEIVEANLALVFSECYIKLSILCLLSGLQPFFCRVRPADLVHYDEGIESSAEC